MKRLLPLALALPLAAPAIALAAPAAPLDEVAQHLRAVASMTASFVQTNRDGKAVSGQLSLKRPGKIRFQYQRGVPLLVVGDGKALTMIDYAVKQVSRWPVGNSPLGVLLDPSKDLARFARVLPSGSASRLLVEARDPKHPEFGTTTIVFDRVGSAPAGLMLAGWSTLDAQGNRTAVVLAGQRYNIAVSDDMFRWTDPRPQGPRR